MAKIVQKQFNFPAKVGYFFQYYVLWYKCWFFFSCFTIIKQWSLGKGDTSDAPASKCYFVYFIFVRVAIVINVFIVNILIYTYLLFTNKIFILISFFSELTLCNNVFESNCKCFYFLNFCHFFFKRSLSVF